MQNLHIYTIGALISTLFLISLGVVCLFSGRKQLLWRTLAVFSFMLGAATFLAFLATRSDDYGHVLLFTRLAYFAVVMSVLYSVYYTSILTGKNKKIDFLKGEVSRRSYLIATALIGAVLLAILMSTKLLIRGFSDSGLGEVCVIYGPIGYIVLAISILGLLIISTTLSRAHRNSTEKSFRDFLRLNKIAFYLIYLPGILLQFAQPIFEFNAGVLVLAAYPTAVVIFYMAILRYQFDRVEDLNRNLEKKVKERTSELMRTQARLAQAEKMASMGVLVAGVVHEINNPVGAVSGMLQTLERAVKKIKAALAEIPAQATPQINLNGSLQVISDAHGVIGAGMKRVSNIAARLKRFYRLDEATLQLTDIHQGLDDTLNLLRYDMMRHIKVEKDYGDIPNILCYPRQLNQVFLNLLLNAKESIRNSGIIYIRTFTDDKKLYLKIKDTGAGISDENMSKIFEPGFTTKRNDSGTGLGLSICREIIRDHHGELAVVSKLDFGTTVTVALPITIRAEAGKPALNENAA